MPPFLLNGVDGMNAKQDRAAPRTVADIERKYGFGKSFAEIMGLIDDTRNEVDSVKSTVKGEITEQLTSLQRNAEEIVAKAVTKEEIADVYGDIDDLKTEVETRMTSEAVTISIREEMENGVEVVDTKTGYRFDKDGLSISETGSEITNLIDNTGMYVKRSGENILVANKDGVEATDLHAKTYLKIGSGEGRSRFEDYGINRTGCFWTGG
jgi:hypothetical protein